MQQKTANENAIRWLYQQFLEWWNERNASMMVALCEENVILIGFDGSQMNGRAEISAELNKIFGSQKTGTYVSHINNVRLVTSDVAILSAVAGMIPHGKSDIDSKINSIQILTALKKRGAWSIAVFQNTPATLDENPATKSQLSEDLRSELARKLSVS